MSIENPERKFSVLPSERRKENESDVEKVRRRRREREEGIKDESLTKLEEKLKNANERVGASNLEQDVEEESGTENDVDDVATEEVAEEEESYGAFLKTFNRLSEEVNRLEELNEAFSSKKNEILKYLKGIADSKTGVDIDNPQEKRNLEDELIGKLKQETEA